MDNLESHLREVDTIRRSMNWHQISQIGGVVSKNGFAPRAALLTALWGDEPRRKAPTLLVFGSGAYVHRSTVGSLVFDFSLLSARVYLGGKESAFHTLFFQVPSV